jgi:cyclohexa-1,5-dienecarbonyl-CoA hydratase
MSYTRLMVTSQPPTGRIILSRPPVNVLDMDMMDELLAAIEEFDQRPDISTIIFAGSDRAFSAGVDVKAHTPDKVRDMLVKFHSVIRALVATRKVTISVVRGSCLGGGAELAAICDLVFTADDATWGFPEITLAAFPPVAAVMLSAIVGQKRAADLVLTGRTINGEEAMRIGLANEAAPADELAEIADEAAERLAQLSPSALAVTKKALYAWDAIHFDKGLQRAEQIYLDELIKLDDAREGIQAFIDKRKPVWKGK